MGRWTGVKVLTMHESPLGGPPAQTRAKCSPLGVSLLAQSKLEPRVWLVQEAQRNSLSTAGAPWHVGYLRAPSPQGQKGTTEWPGGRHIGLCVLIYPDLPPMGLWAGSSRFWATIGYATLGFCSVGLSDWYLAVGGSGSIRSRLLIGSWGGARGGALLPLCVCHGPGCQAGSCPVPQHRLLARPHPASLMATGT